MNPWHHRCFFFSQAVVIACYHIIWNEMSQQFSLNMFPHSTLAWSNLEPALCKLKLQGMRSHIWHSFKTSDSTWPQSQVENKKRNETKRFLNTVVPQPMAPSPTLAAKRFADLPTEPGSKTWAGMFWLQTPRGYICLMWWFVFLGSLGQS
jgi:hypothetical protein